MEVKLRITLLFSIFSTLLLSSTPLHASNLTANQSLLNAAFQYANCKTNFTVGLINYVVNKNAVLSPLIQSSTILQQDNSRLAVLANEGNISQFRIYLSGTYDPELALVGQNFSSQIKAANLSSNTISAIRVYYNSSKITLQSCSNTTTKSFAIQKLNQFNASIVQFQNQINSINTKGTSGISTNSLSQILQTAQSLIIQPFASAISQATTNQQLSAATSKYCLFDGCKNGTNFHLEAKFDIQLTTLRLDHLESNPNITSSSLTQALSDISAATVIINQVGNATYKGSQGANIFTNLSAAYRAMDLAQAKSTGFKQISTEQKAINIYQNKSNVFLSNGLDVDTLDQLIQQSQQVIASQQSSVSLATNASQISQAIKGQCLENSCKNGTNLHLATRFQLAVLNATLALAESKANSSSSVKLNQTDLSLLEGYLSSSASIINSAGTSQYSQAQSTELANYFANFSAKLKLLATYTKPAPKATSSSGKQAASNSIPTTATVNANTIAKVSSSRTSANASASAAVKVSSTK